MIIEKRQEMIESPRGTPPFIPTPLLVNFNVCDVRYICMLKAGIQMTVALSPRQFASPSLEGLILILQKSSPGLFALGAFEKVRRGK